MHGSLNNSCTFGIDFVPIRAFHYDLDYFRLSGFLLHRDKLMNSTTLMPKLESDIVNWSVSTFSSQLCLLNYGDGTSVQQTSYS